MSNATCARSRSEFLQKNVPPQLRERLQWVCWRNTQIKGKWRKIPICCITGREAKTNDPNSWTDFDDALTVFEQDPTLTGIGFVFTADDEFCGIDLDQCRQLFDGTLNGFAQTVVRATASYAELSPSETGVKIFCRAKVARALKITEPFLEIYSAGRYFTMTGLHLHGTPLEVIDAQQAVDELISGYRPREHGSSNGTSTSNGAKIPKGGQHNYLMKQAGKYRYGGDPEDVIYKKIELDYYTHCEPPHNDLGHLREIARSVCKYAAGDAAADAVIESALTVPDVLDMPADCLAGRLGEICERYMTGFPRCYSYIALVTTAGVKLTPHDPTLRTNLMSGLVGDVGTGKTDAIHAAELGLGLPESQIERAKVGSAEGLLEKIGERITPALYSPDELSALLSKAQIQNASIAFVLPTLFYQDNSPLVAAHRKKIAFNARLSILGGIVAENFPDHFGVAALSGLYDRFLLADMPTSFAYVHQLEPKFHSFLPPGTAYHQPPVHSDVHEWLAQQRKDRPEINPRVIEIALRVASICSAYDGVIELRADHLAPALKLAEYQSRVRQHLQPNPGRNPDAIVGHRIMSLLREHPGEWLNQRDVLRRLHCSRDFGQPVANRVINALDSCGELELNRTSPASGGRKVTLIRAVQDGN